MKRYLWVGAALLVAAPWTLAADEPKKDQGPSKEKSAGLADQIKKLERDYLVKQQELRKAHLKQLMELVRTDPKNPATFASLRSIALGRVPESKEAIQLLQEFHGQTAGIGTFAWSLQRSPDDITPFLDAIVARNPNENDKLLAQVVMALWLKRKGNNEDVSEADRIKAIADATKILKSLQQNAKDIQLPTRMSLKKFVQGQLATIENVLKLAIGKHVPDIIGEDLDGKNFKLSDYRGKVVLLDYWAHW